MNEIQNQEILKASKSSGKWIYITPVSGVILTKDVKNEFRINMVSIISKIKAKNEILKLIGSERLNKNKKIYEDFFNLSDVFAITNYSGRPDDVRITCRKTTRNELAILALSHLGYGKRRLGPYPSIHGESPIKLVKDILLEKSIDRIQISSQVVGNLSPLALHGHWLRFQKDNYFIKLLKILRGEIRVSREWRDDLERAAILAGQGLSFNETSQSFLWNVIALETLLNEGEEKFSKEFPKRAEAFLGWVGFWKEEEYAKKIIDLYKKRNDFVHKGKKDHINKDDLLFTDNLIFNLLNNIVQHEKIFYSKKSVMDFSKKVEAEHLLGLKQKVRPKSLTFIRNKYYEDDLKES